MGFVTRKSRRVVIAIAVLGCLALAVPAGLWLLISRGGTANLMPPTTAARAFFESIHEQRPKEAYSLLSERFTPRITYDQFLALVQADGDVFQTYTRFDVCEWGLYIDNGLVVDERGLLYYRGGAINIQVSLHKDSDGAWRIQGIRINRDTKAKPFGLCA